MKLKKGDDVTIHFWDHASGGKSLPCWVRGLVEEVNDHQVIVIGWDHHHRPDHEHYTHNVNVEWYCIERSCVFRIDIKETVRTIKGPARLP